MGFGDLTNPRGGDNLKGTHFMADHYNPNWWVDEFDMFEDVKRKIYSMPPQETYLIWERFGEKVFTLLKAYTIRQGLTRRDDWPDRFYREPLPEGAAKGAVLSGDVINRLLDEYYGLRGWDKGLGLPTGQKLIELGLGDIANELTKLGKLPGGKTSAESHK